MDISYLLDSLNDQQREAVASEPRNLLILAGAGSGKTRVLVHRIAWLMSVEHASPFAILAVTFTNKAAYEMRGRIESLRGAPLSGMWVGTFHGLAHRILRAHWQDAKLPETFQIMDSDDQYRIIRRIQRNLDLDEAKWPPKQSQWFINKSKEEGRRAKDITQADNSFFTEVMRRIYTEYEQICERSGLVDFSELLLRSLELLKNNPEIRDHYQNRFQHILVDEFQDTNTIQYAWLKILKGAATYIIA
ncbi:MAG: UvrD-helicase domain-containing protein, partial [Gammaproteobacteria bacterium]|nr:UvrD-helicase domain-containing protein [Gammaproteobacteria bacterium]